MFDAFDRNGNGRIDIAELDRALGHYGYARLNRPVFFH